VRFIIQRAYDRRWHHRRVYILLPTSIIISVYVSTSNNWDCISKRGLQASKSVIAGEISKAPRGRLDRVAFLLRTHTIDDPPRKQNHTRGYCSKEWTGQRYWRRRSWTEYQGTKNAVRSKCRRCEGVRPEAPFLPWIRDQLLLLRAWEEHTRRAQKVTVVRSEQILCSRRKWLSK
jgi:hypothetical protein